ncbi:MAG: crossover junction endodeoxyribonuclease RuvC [Bradymonadia bacterium]
MIVIGIDPGSHRCGWGLVTIDGSRITHVDNGVIVAKGNAPLAARLHAIFTQLEAVIARHTPAAAAIEQVFVGHGNARSALVLGQARGVALLALSRGGLAPESYTAQQVKKAASGSGRADKDQVQQMVAMRLGLPEVPQEDAADAVAVALCHAQHLALGVPRPPAKARKRGGRAGLTAWAESQSSKPKS